MSFVNVSEGKLSLVSTGVARCNGSGQITLEGPLIVDEPADDGGKATLSNSGTFILDGVNGNYYRLTQAVTSQNGQAYYSVIAGANWNLVFDMYIGGGTGADAVYVFAYVDSIPLVESDAAGGYVFAFDEFTDELQWRGFGLDFAQAAGYTIDDGVWKTVEMEFRSDGTTNTLRVWVGGTLRFNQNHTPPGDMSKIGSSNAYPFGFGARTGGSTNIHAVRNIRFRPV